MVTAKRDAPYRTVPDPEAPEAGSSLHPLQSRRRPGVCGARSRRGSMHSTASRSARRLISARSQRSEEHTSELQSLMRISYAVFCLKKKTKNSTTKPRDHTATSYIYTQTT